MAASKTLISNIVDVFQAAIDHKASGKLDLRWPDALIRGARGETVNGQRTCSALIGDAEGSNGTDAAILYVPPSPWSVAHLLGRSPIITGSYQHRKEAPPVHDLRQDPYLAISMMRAVTCSSFGKHRSVCCTVLSGARLSRCKGVCRAPSQASRSVSSDCLEADFSGFAAVAVIRTGQEGLVKCACQLSSAAVPLAS